MTKRYLFLCVGNSCRSQMAEGFARYYARRDGLDVEVMSAGTQPAGAVHPDAIRAMAERGIDLHKHHAKALDLAWAERADGIFTMGCSAEEACPAHIVKRIEDWGIEDPVGRPYAIFQAVRDQVDGRIRALLGVASDAPPR